MADRSEVSRRQRVNAHKCPMWSLHSRGANAKPYEEKVAALIWEQRQAGKRTCVKIWSRLRSLGKRVGVFDTHGSEQQ